MRNCAKEDRAMSELQQKSIEEILEEIRKKTAPKKQAKGERFKGGTVRDYLELVRVHPELVETPQQRLYRVVFKEPGRKEIKYDEDPRLFQALGLTRDAVVFRYNAFSEFYGIEEAIEEYASYLYQAQSGGEASRQAVWFVGPVGSGKSSFTDKLKALLEGERMFVLEGCVMWDDPLRVLPRHVRDDLARELGVHISFKDDICPNCRWRLNEELKNDYLKFPVAEVNFSIRHLVGIGTVTYVEAEEADISELVGALDLSRLGDYPEDHPLVSRPSGICNKANGGILEYVEAPDMPASYLTPLNTITQEGRLGTTGRQPQVSVRTNIILHSNEESFLRFFANEENKKIYDRVVVIHFPYNVRLDEEIRIYQKLINFSEFRESHAAPYALEFAASVAILTRLKPSESCPDPFIKMQILNGDEPARMENTTKTVTAAALREEQRWDGMDGLSTRFVVKALDAAFSYQRRNGINCIDPITVFHFLKARLERDKILAQDEERFKIYGACLARILEAYSEEFKRTLSAAFVVVRDDYLENIFQRYLDNAELAMRVHQGERELESKVDRKLLEFIEKLGDITNVGSAMNFRQEMVRYAYDCKSKGKPLHHSHHPKMKLALEKVVRLEMNKFLQTPHGERLRTPELEAMYMRLVNELIAKGYCTHCASSAINWYSEHLH